MVIFYCCGCRAQYAAAPRRCDRCKGKAFTAVDDNAPTRALLDPAEPAPVVVEDLDAELREAFAASERFRQSSLSGRPMVSVPALLAGLPSAAESPVLEGDDGPATPRDRP
jgi:hypothetical protein